MKYVFPMFIILLFFAGAVLAGSSEYTSQRQAQESSYQDQIANKALQDYYREHPEQSPDVTGATRKDRSRKSSAELHKKTFGSDSNSEVWGTKKR